ncbi:hypothetical protein ACRAKJ_24605 [Saccharothrix sp. DSM 118769]
MGPDTAYERSIMTLTAAPASPAPVTPPHPTTGAAAVGAPSSGAA